MKARSFAAVSGNGFTILELLTVVVVIGILTVMVVGISAKMRFGAEKVACVSNLKNLYVAANGYVQDQQHWPQIRAGASKAEKEAYAKGWIEALRPYGVSETNWRCPTIERILKGDPSYDPEEVRVDYTAMPFDDKPTSPHQFPKQPWFVERGAVHDGGNLLIRTNGKVLTLEEAIRYP